MSFVLGACAAVAVILLGMWGVAGFEVPERAKPQIEHVKQDVGDGCVLHYYRDPYKGLTKWVTCPNKETIAIDRKSCGKSCSKDEAVEVRKESK